MAKHILVVLSNAASEEREQEFNDWYTREVHEVVKIPGYAVATRCVAAPAQMAPNPPSWKYLAIYEIETEDPAKAVEALRNALAQRHRTPPGVPVDASGMYAYFYTVADRVTAKG